MTEPRAGYKYITALPDGEACVGITNFKGQVMVATTDRIYRLGDDGVLEPLKFKLDLQDTSDDFVCPECNGTFRYDGVHHTEEQQYGGRCDECGFTSMFGTQPPLDDAP